MEVKSLPPKIAQLQRQVGINQPGPLGLVSGPQPVQDRFQPQQALFGAKSKPSRYAVKAEVTSDQKAQQLLLALEELPEDTVPEVYAKDVEAMLPKLRDIAKSDKYTGAVGYYLIASLLNVVEHKREQTEAMWPVVKFLSNHYNQMGMGRRWLFRTVLGGPPRLPQNFLEVRSDEWTCQYFKDPRPYKEDEEDTGGSYASFRSGAYLERPVPAMFHGDPAFVKRVMAEDSIWFPLYIDRDLHKAGLIEKEVSGHVSRDGNLMMYISPAGYLAMKQIVAEGPPGDATAAEDDVTLL